MCIQIDVCVRIICCVFGYLHVHVCVTCDAVVLLPEPYWLAWYYEIPERDT